MKNITIVILSLLLFGGAFALKERGKGRSVADSAVSTGEEALRGPEPVSSLPKLVDLGSDRCVPCKQMAPILESLSTEFKGTFEVQFIDVWKDSGAGESWGVRVIPTQVFLDAEGKERFRHEGFFAREDILAKWRELGVDVGQSSGAAS